MALLPYFWAMQGQSHTSCSSSTWLGTSLNMEKEAEVKLLCTRHNDIWGGGGQRHTPTVLKSPQYPWRRRLGGAHSRSAGFEPGSLNPQKTHFKAAAFWWTFLPHVVEIPGCILGPRLLLSSVHPASWSAFKCATTSSVFSSTNKIVFYTVWVIANCACLCIELFSATAFLAHSL